MRPIYSDFSSSVPMALYGKELKYDLSSYFPLHNPTQFIFETLIRKSSIICANTIETCSIIPLAYEPLIILFRFNLFHQYSYWDFDRNRDRYVCRFLCFNISSLFRPHLKIRNLKHTISPEHEKYSYDSMKIFIFIRGHDTIF